MQHTLNLLKKIKRMLGTEKKSREKEFNSFPLFTIILIHSHMFTKNWIIYVLSYAWK